MKELFKKALTICSDSTVHDKHPRINIRSSGQSKVTAGKLLKYWISHFSLLKDFNAFFICHRMSGTVQLAFLADVQTFYNVIDRFSY